MSFGDWLTLAATIGVTGLVIAGCVVLALYYYSTHLD